MPHALCDAANRFSLMDLVAAPTVFPLFVYANRLSERLVRHLELDKCGSCGDYCRISDRNLVNRRVHDRLLIGL